LGSYHLNENIPFSYCNDSLDKLKDGSPSIIFSTKKAAEKWINENKPKKKTLEDRVSDIEKTLSELYAHGKPLHVK